MPVNEAWRITDFLAIWGAAVATVVGGWNIYKDFIQRRVLVFAGFMIVTGSNDEVICIRVTNRSTQKVKVTHIVSYPYRFRRYRWLRRFLRRFAPKPPSTTAHLFAYPLFGRSLPCLIEAMDNDIILFPPKNLPEIEEIQIVTADGREAFCSRSDIRKIQADNTYKAARAGT